MKIKTNQQLKLKGSIHGASRIILADGGVWAVNQRGEINLIYIEEITRAVNEYAALNRVEQSSIALANEAIHYRDAKHGKEFLNAAIDAHSQACLNLAALRKKSPLQL